MLENREAAAEGEMCEDFLGERETWFYHPSVKQPNLLLL